MDEVFELDVKTVEVLLLWGYKLELKVDVDRLLHKGSVPKHGCLLIVPQSS